MRTSIITACFCLTSVCSQKLFSQELSASVMAGRGSRYHAGRSSSRIFISPMEGNLDGFVASELIKQKLPVVVVTQEKDADYVLAGVSIKGDDHWYNAVFNRGKDKNEGNVRLLDVHTKTMTWAGEAGDRSLLMTGWRRGGQRKIAERIVHQLKKDVFNDGR